MFRTGKKNVKTNQVCKYLWAVIGEDSLEEVSVWQKKFLWQAFEYRICIW